MSESRIEESRKLKRFEDALAGHRLSWTAAHQISAAICELRGIAYATLCSGDYKLPDGLRSQLQAIVTSMKNSGIEAARDMRTPHQRDAADRKRRTR